MKHVLNNVFAGWLVALTLLSGSVCAETNVWTGGAGSSLWNVTGNWSLGRVPTCSTAGGDDVLIDGAVVDYNMTGTGNFKPVTSVSIINGGVWTQSTAISMSPSGKLIVDRGTFDTGMSSGFTLNNGTMTVDNDALVVLRKAPSGSGTSRIELKSGIIRFMGGTWSSANLFLSITGGRLEASGLGVGFTARTADVLTGGEMLLDGELGFTQATTWDGTVATAAGLYLSQGAAIPLMQKGQIILTGCAGSADDGVRRAGAGTGCINFGIGCKGVLTLVGIATGDVYSKYFGLANPKIKYDGAKVASEAKMLELFDVVASTTVEGAVDVMLKRASAGAASFSGDACTFSGLTAGSVVLSATIEEAGDPAATLLACLGTTDGGKDLTAWGSPVIFGTATDGAPCQYTAALAPGYLYYYRLAASNETDVTFATPTPAYFMAAEVGIVSPVTELPESSAVIELVVSRPSNNNCTDVALSVPYSVSGTAVLDTHYKLGTKSPLTIPAKQASVTLKLTPVIDAVSSENHTVRVSLGASTQYLLGASSAVEVVLTDVPLPGGVTNVFTGAVSTDGTVAGNWSKGRLPTADDVILFSPSYATATQLLWKDTMTPIVAGWVQPELGGGKEFSVTFSTTPEAPLTVDGDVVLETGYWNHEGPALEPTKALAVNVNGNLYIGSDASVNGGNGLGGANNRQPPRGYRLSGPGMSPLPEGETVGTGSSYGGEGATNGVTYGSIINPLSYGSSGRGDSGDNYSGGGLIVLNVLGTTRLDGYLGAQGYGNSLAPGKGGSAGGTVNLTTGTLEGNGTLAVDGGTDTARGSGGGGRVRVKLTDAAATTNDFAGKITAYGKAGDKTTVPTSAAGTVVWQLAGQGAAEGTVVVDNNVARTDADTVEIMRATQLPALLNQDESLKKTAWVLRGTAAVRLTKSLTVESLTVESPDACLLTEGHTLTVANASRNGVKLPVGVYTSANSSEWIYGPGALSVLGNGTAIILQ